MAVCNYRMLLFVGLRGGLSLSMEISKVSLGVALECFPRDVFTFLTRGSHHPVAAAGKSCTSIASVCTAEFGITFAFLSAHFQDSLNVVIWLVDVKRGMGRP